MGGQQQEIQQLRQKIKDVEAKILIASADFNLSGRLYEISTSIPRYLSPGVEPNSLLTARDEAISLFRSKHAEVDFPEGNKTFLAYSVYKIILDTEIAQHHHATGAISDEKETHFSVTQKDDAERKKQPFYKFVIEQMALNGIKRDNFIEYFVIDPLVVNTRSYLFEESPLSPKERYNKAIVRIRAAKILNSAPDPEDYNALLVSLFGILMDRRLITERTEECEQICDILGDSYAVIFPEGKEAFSYIKRNLSAIMEVLQNFSENYDIYSL